MSLNVFLTATCRASSAISSGDLAGAAGFVAGEVAVTAAGFAGGFVAGAVTGFTATGASFAAGGATAAGFVPGEFAFKGFVAGAAAVTGFADGEVSAPGFTTVAGCLATAGCTTFGGVVAGSAAPALGTHIRAQLTSSTTHASRTKNLGVIRGFFKGGTGGYASSSHSLSSARSESHTPCGETLWGSGLEDGNKHSRENLPFILADKAGGTVKTGRYLDTTKGNQGDLLTTMLACAGVPLDRPIGIATKQIAEMKA